MAHKSLQYATRIVFSLFNADDHLVLEVRTPTCGRQHALPARQEVSDVVNIPKPQLLSYGMRVQEQHAAQTEHGRVQKIALLARPGFAEMFLHLHQKRNGYECGCRGILKH